MNLTQWALRWNVPAEALVDLRREFGTLNAELVLKKGESEAAVQSKIRLEASKKGGRLWRNNVGALYNSEGSFIRYGLANDSEALNKKIKSSDLIGLRPITIKSGHVGMVLGQFVARETKPENWRYSGTEREKAQLKFLEVVMSLGGDAAFANSTGTL